MCFKNVLKERLVSRMHCSSFTPKLCYSAIIDFFALHILSTLTRLFPLWKNGTEDCTVNVVVQVRDCRSVAVISVNKASQLLIGRHLLMLGDIAFCFVKILIIELMVDDFTDIISHRGVYTCQFSLMEYTILFLVPEAKQKY